MKSIVIIFLTVCCITGILAQTNQVGGDEWLQDLFKHGVEMTDDSIYISQEVLFLLEDETLRAEFYDNQQNLPLTISYIQKGELKKASWNFINLYLMNDYMKDKVLKSVLTYNQMFNMEKVLVSAFYTYCYTDSSIGYIEDGKPVIESPHILEEKLQAVREIIHYMNKYNAEYAVDSTAR